MGLWLNVSRIDKNLGKIYIALKDLFTKACLQRTHGLLIKFLYEDIILRLYSLGLSKNCLLDQRMLLGSDLFSSIAWSWSKRTLNADVLKEATGLDY